MLTRPAGGGLSNLNPDPNPNPNPDQQGQSHTVRQIGVWWGVVSLELAIQGYV